MTKSVAVLGCGPAGLLVAHAAQLNGWNFGIFSKKQKSVLKGAQYLHAPIPGIIEGDGVMLDYSLRGTPETYRHKVYGDAWDGNTSPEDYPEPHRAWDLRHAYELMWFNYGWQVAEFDFVEMRYPSVVFAHYDLVISTVPRTIWDDDNSHFARAYIWAEGGYELGDLRQENNTVICDGTSDCRWYRSAIIFGQGTLEWPWSPEKEFAGRPTRGAVRVVKPLEYTGNAATDIIHLGRYAQWQKGILTSDVFTNAMDIFAKDSIDAR